MYLKFFYPDSRDMHGMPAAMGYSVLLSIHEGIQNPFFSKVFFITVVTILDKIAKIVYLN
jgi:hypothetical protein